MTGVYKDGITISYKESLSCYIRHAHNIISKTFKFSFLGKSYYEVMSYFKQYSGNIYIEGETSIVSEFLGISTYFEDGIKEVAIFSKSYKAEIIKGLEIVN